MSWSVGKSGGYAANCNSGSDSSAIPGCVFHSYHLVLLAEAYGKAGQAEEGLAALTEALAVVDNSGERFYEAEVYRLKGELTLQVKASSPRSTVAEETEACFLKALAIARQQQAKSLELRATMSLARVWQHQGKRAEAHKMLFDLYSWFTEGFATKDLQEAKALLEELTSRAMVETLQKESL